MNKKIAVIILMVVAAIFFTIPFISINRSLKIKKFGVHAEGTVLKRTTKKGLSEVTVSFNTSDGNQVTANASKRSFVSTGEKVMLYYDPASPQTIDFGDT